MIDENQKDKKSQIQSKLGAARSDVSPKKEKVEALPATAIRERLVSEDIFKEIDAKVYDNVIETTSQNSFEQDNELDQTEALQKENT